jgi:hypothetical protein
MCKKLGLEVGWSICAKSIQRPIEWMRGLQRRNSLAAVCQESKSSTGGGHGERARDGTGLGCFRGEDF